MGHCCGQGNNTRVYMKYDGVIQRYVLVSGEGLAPIVSAYSRLILVDRSVL